MKYTLRLVIGLVFCVTVVSLFAQQDATVTEKAKQGSGKIRGLGLIPAPPSQAPAAATVLQEILQRRAKMARVPLALAATADNSAGLPPVGDQGIQGSCVSWAVGYYAKSYQEAKEHGWSLADPAHQFSPRFLYNQLQGFDEGSTFEGNLNLVLNQGCASFASQPYDDADYLTWPTADAYLEGIPYRAAAWDYLGNGETPQVFEAVKAIMTDGGICNVGLPIYRRGAYSAGLFDDLCPTNCHYLMPASCDTNLAGYHALTLVGYDETKFNGKGGYKVVNQWGADWGTNGFAWISEPFLTTYAFGFYRMTDRVGYAPSGLAHWKVSHSYWGWNLDNVTVKIGVGSQSSPSWSRLLVTGLERDSLTIDMWVDITEAATYLPADWTNRWWLSVTDSAAWDVGTVSTFDIIWNGQTSAGTAPLPFDTSVDEGTFWAYVPCGAAASTNYYVNDAGTNGDVYCTTVGNDTNDGLTPCTPKRSLAEIFRCYTVKGGDTVWVDAGTYSLAETVVLDYHDQGDADHALRVIGPPAPAKASLQVAPGIVGLQLYYTRHVEIENLTMSGGASAVWSKEPRSHTFRNLTVTGCSGDAISLVGEYYEGYYERSTLDHCLVYGVGGRCLGVSVTDAAIEQSTLVAGSGKTCANVDNDWRHNKLADIRAANSLLVAPGGTCLSAPSTGASALSSAYNDQYGSSQLVGADDLQVDPLFANPGAGDFHLKSSAGRWDPLAGAGAGGWAGDATNSPCIDAGDPIADASAEPAPNGNRLNLGVYGGTGFASKSPAARYLSLIQPVAGQVLQAQCAVTWRYHGAGWQASDTLRAEYSPDGGTNWIAVAAGANRSHWRSPWSWDLHALSAGSNYVLRLVCNQEPTVFAQTTGPFVIRSIPMAAVPLFYVNDTYDPTNDVYCTAAGSESNDGLSPATPKASIQAVLDGYNTAPGSVIYVDSGVYTLSSNIVINSGHSGSASAPVSIVGSTNAVGSLINRTNVSAGSYAFHLAGCSYVALANLRIVTADKGVYAASAANCTIQHCRVTGCNAGIHAQGSGGHVVMQNVIAACDKGLLLTSWPSGSGGSLSVVNNTFHGNLSGSFWLTPGWTGSLTIPITLRNNIFSQSAGYCIYQSVANNSAIAYSDYNDFFVTGSASTARESYSSTYLTLAAWQAASGRDAHSFAVDPQFADVTNLDVHVKSIGGRWNADATMWVADAVHSPTIDAGPTSDAVGAEPSPNAGRINLGAYGGTAEASKSRPNQYLHLNAPAGDERWGGTQTVLWSVDPAGWQTNGLLRIEYSADDGATWTVVQGGESVSVDAGQWAWDTTRHTNCWSARLRLTSLAEPGLWDQSQASFSVVNGGSRYYVNDGSTNDDVYCAAVGNDANDGRSPVTPKATAQAILTAYDLKPGDLLYLDTGYYPLSAGLTADVRHQGSAVAPIRIQGSTRGTVFQTATASMTALSVVGSYVEVDSLTLKGGAGISFSGAYCTAKNNVCIGPGSSGTGIVTEYGNVVQNNVLCGHALGIYARSGTAVINNTIWSSGSGITTDINGAYYFEFHSITVKNNIIRAQGGGKYCLYNGNIDVLGESDYNVLLATSGAVVGMWMYGGGNEQSYASVEEWADGMARQGWVFDRHSTGVDPLFANVSSNDFHLRSTAGRYDPSSGLPSSDPRAWLNDSCASPCLDAGDPADPVGEEPAPNGGQINIGAYGGTRCASKTPAGTRELALWAPGGGEVWMGRREICWRAFGSGWQNGDSIRLEYSADAGGTWIPIAGATGCEWSSGAFAWDTASLPSRPFYRIRATCNQDASVWAASSGNFTIYNHVIDYYVNDATTTGDVYCAAPGDDANDGLSAATPKATIQSILDVYDLAPGETVYVDTGLYMLTNDVVVTAADGGASGGYVTLCGSTHAEGTILDRNSPSNGCAAIRLAGCGLVRLERIGIRHAEHGVYGVPSTDCIVSQCRITDCVNGVRAAGGSNLQVANCVIVNNSYGVFANPMTLFVINNTFSGNLVAGFCYAYAGSTSQPNLTFRNNVFSQDSGWCLQSAQSKVNIVYSDYNVYDTTGTAGVASWAGSYPTLSAWQSGLGKESHSASGPACFADPSAGDFHLLSAGGRWDPAAQGWTNDAVSSPCLDAGSPSDPVGDEPEPNGGVRNVGAYGGTSEASKSPAGGKVTLVAPNGGEAWKGVRTIAWNVAHQGWADGDTVSLLFSADSGTNWIAIAGGAALPAQAQLFAWDVYSAPTGTHCRVKVVSDQDSNVWDVCDADFTISAGGAYFVNDTSITNDAWCTAPGDDANDGTSPATPKGTVQAVLAAYALVPGDVVRIDTGVYNLTSNIVVLAANGGTSASPVVFEASPFGVAVNRGDTNSGCYGWHVSGASNVVIRTATVTNRPGVPQCWMRVTGAYNGVVLQSGKGCRLSRCEAFGNLYSGVLVNGCVSPVLEYCLTRQTVDPVGGNGIRIQGGSSVTVRNCTLFGNGRYGLSFSQSAGYVAVNNIVCADGLGDMAWWVNGSTAARSDYNDIFVANGAYVGWCQGTNITTLARWRKATGGDPNSMEHAPLFVDPSGDDFHLQSTVGSYHAGVWLADGTDSPGLDAGDPAQAAGTEPTPNGGRVNLGAFGGTEQASQTPGRWLLMTTVGNREPLHAWEPLRWVAPGADWDSAETVHLDYSADAGLSWAPVQGATGLPYNAGSCWWDSRTVESGTQYLFRVVSDSVPALTNVTPRVYAVDNKGASPTLAWTGEWGYESGGVSPDGGVQGLATFTFRVTYSDADDDAPLSGFPQLLIRKSGAEIPGSPFAMTAADSGDLNYADGKTYSYAISTLVGGDDYEYAFAAQDSGGAPATGAPVTWHTGPRVEPTRLPASVIYVSLSGNPSFPYTNWLTAARDIQSAVNAGGDGSVVLVSNGVYQVSSQIVVNNGIAVRSVNGPATTVVDGGYPARYVRCFYLTHSNAVVEGLTITGGYASDSGGGVYLTGGGQIRNSIIRGNRTGTYGLGGGVYCGNGSRLENCLISGNSAGAGGGAYCIDSGVTRNCTITGNSGTSAGTHGGGLYCQNSAIINSIVYFNSVNNYENGSVYSYSNCCITPAVTGGGNISVNPLFMNAAEGNYRLTTNSPCVNTGMNQGVMFGVMDLDGHSRIAGGSVDMGAYEVGVLACDFTASPRQGPEPLAVVFTPLATGADLAGLRFQWDFNDDASNDLASVGAQPVTNTYLGARFYSVRVTAYTDAGETCAVVKTNYIQALQIPLVVSSLYGTVTPPRGTNTYDYLSYVPCSVLDSPVLSGVSTQYVCSGWRGTGSVPASGADTNVMVTLTNVSTIAWSWKTQYWFSATSGLNGGAVSTNGWYNRGSVALATAIPDSGYHFAGWAGDVPAQSQYSNPVMVAMSQARSIQATFESDATTYPLAVSSAWGAVAPERGTNWFAYGSSVPCAVQGSPVDLGGGTQYVCTGWSGTGSVPSSGTGTSVTATITRASSLIWNWQMVLDLGWPVNAVALVWTTGGNAPWFAQMSVTHDGGMAAQSGDINNSQTSWLETVMQGPALLTYWRKVSSEGNFDWLALYMDGVLQTGRISGNVDWQVQTNAIPVGVHTLRWQYSKDGSSSSGSDAGWLDEVRYSPRLDVSVSGMGAVDVPGGWYLLGSNVVVTATSLAHWHFDRWSGDTNGCSVSSNKISYAVDRPRAITACFSLDEQELVMRSAHGGLQWSLPVGFGMEIGFPGYTKSETLTNFPALVVLSTNIVGFSYAGFATTNAGVLRFTDAAGLRDLNYEIEEWNTNGNSYVWVQVPELSSSNDYIRAYWMTNGQSAPSSATNGAVWEGGFKGVWHLQESPANTSPQMRDSTTNANHGACQNMVGGDLIAGKVGGAVSLNGSSKYINCGNAASLQNTVGTLEAWIATSANDSTYRAIVCKQLAYGMFISNRSLIVYDWGNSVGRNTGFAIADGAWHHVAFSYQNNVSNGTAVYVDGRKILECTVKISGQTVGEYIGYGNSPSQYHNGLVDEVRASGSKRSGNWLWATWLNMASNAVFNSCGAVHPLYATNNGTKVCVTNSFPYGTEVTCALTNAAVSEGQGTQYVCEGWTMAGNAPVSGSGLSLTFPLTNNASLNWLWQTNYWLDVAAGGPGTVTPGSGWFARGCAPGVTAQPSNYYHFVAWTGTVTSALNPLSLTMNQPYLLSALFGENLATRGTPEWWLAQHGWTNDFNAAETTDADCDGLLNWQEYCAGTDPANPASVLRMTALGRAVRTNDHGYLPIAFQSVSNKAYVIQVAPAVTGVWLTVSEPIVAVSNRTQVLVRMLESMPQAFYRVSVSTPLQP